MNNSTEIKETLKDLHDLSISNFIDMGTEPLITMKSYQELFQDKIIKLCDLLDSKDVYTK